MKMFKKALTWYLAVAMFIIGIAPHAEGAFSPSVIINAAEDQRISDVRTIEGVLETKLVQQRLADLGFTANEIKEKLSMLSDQQIHSYAQQLDDLRAGGDGLGLVIGVLVIIILIIVILHLTGHKVVVH